MTVTVFLLWQLVAGVPQDVDAFMFEGQCHEMKQMMQAQLKAAIAQTGNDELKKLEIVGCQPVEIKVPARI